MKSQKDRGRAIKAIYLFLGILFVSVGIFALFFYRRTMRYTLDDVRYSDIEQVNSVKPECLLISMLPTENFSAEDFEYYRGISTVKASHRFENLYDIRDFLTSIDVCPNNVYIVSDPVYLGSLYGFHAFLYGMAYKNTLLSVIREHTDTMYEILLPYYSLEYWNRLSDQERENAIASLRDFVNIFYGEPNVRLYFAGGEEWLIANPGNYETENCCNEAVTRKIIAFTFSNASYLLTPEKMESKFSLICNLAENISSVSLFSEYDLMKPVDLSDTDIVFFGDSVIGNFTDSTSIPGVIAGLSNARVYNLGVGGTAATFNGNPEDLSLVTMVNLFLDKDSSRIPEDKQAKYSMEEYISDHAGGTARNTCFILNYGLNDFFSGMPIDISQNADESACYTGAFRSAVALLKEAYPDSRIILLTPTYSIRGEGGTVSQSSYGGTLYDYVNAVIRVADETNVEYIDNYNDLGFDQNNFAIYLQDDCHPNELGRYIIGRHILQHSF